MPRILVIDHDPRTAAFVSRAVTANGSAVDAARDGKQGLRMGRAGRYQLVVLELLLPDIDGVALLHQMLASRPEQRALVLSTVSDMETKVRCLDLGASDYVTKPFALAELLARVRVQLRLRDSAPARRWVRAGRISLDTRRHAAELRGREVRLSPHEFLLLKLLVEREACTREELLAEVWGYSFDPGSNVVDVCVRRLRSKLGVGVIETVRGVGYALAGAGIAPPHVDGDNGRPLAVVNLPRVPARTPMSR